METNTQKEANDAHRNLLTLEEVQKTTIQPSPVRKDKKSIIRIAIFLLCGILNAILGILSIHYNYTELILQERIRMRPGLPPLEWWRQPPFPLKLKIYLFNVTNPIEFLDGIDDKLRLQEVGPIVFQEKVLQTDIVHHENSTLSFTTERSVHFWPEENEPGILNRTVIMLNPTLLGLVSYLADANFVQRIAFKMISSNDNVFLRRTVHEILYNNTSPMLESLSSSILGFLLPRNNTGILYNAYFPKTSRFNVKIGAKHGFEHFFKMHSFNGATKIPGFEDEKRSTCPIWLENARDGANLPPYMTRDTVITAWREDITSTIDLFYEKDVKWANLDAYQYMMPPTAFDRLENKSEDCRAGAKGTIPNGVIDGSVVSFGIPTAFSLPHYYGTDGFFRKFIDGLEPDADKHGTYSIVEPISGFPLKEVARLQSNLIVPKLRGFSNDIERFSEMILPGFWAEYSMEMPGFMILFTKMIVVYVPYLQIVMVISFLCLSMGFLYSGITSLPNIDSRSPRKAVYSTVNSFKRRMISPPTTDKDIK